MKRNLISTIGFLIVGMWLSHPAFSQSTVIPDQITIDSEQLSDQLKIFPNPSDGRFQLDFEYDGNKKVVAKIFDITGKLVKDISEILVNNKSTVTADVDLGAPRSGIYFLRVEIGKNTFTKKIVIR